LKLVLAMAKGSASSEPDADKEAALLTTAQLIAIGMGKCPALQPPQQAGRHEEPSRPGGAGNGA
jgi:hypothetical protein